MLYHISHISVFVLALLSSSPIEVTGYDYLPVFFPLPFFLLIVAVLVEIDNKRTLTNFELQTEIKRIKHMHDVRKKTEEILDGN